MGQIFKLAHQHLADIPADSVFVEIGSDRWEGSTEYFAKLAVDNNTVLHTVDIMADAKHRLEQTAGIVWHIANGQQWAKYTYSKINKKISCLYLDNFDYDWDVNQQSPMIQQQKKEYKEKFNVVMNNQACQTEHMAQMINLYPHMADNGIIIVDDTYQINDCWVGKCGPVVLFLLAQGYDIVAAADYGVILKKIKS